MTMDATPEGRGRWHISLGPVEKAATALIGALLAAGAIWLIASVNTLLTQQAVTNQQLLTISGQISGVPAMSTQVAELKVRVDQHDQDIRELEQLREVKR